MLIVFPPDSVYHDLFFLKKEKSNGGVNKRISRFQKEIYSFPKFIASQAFARTKARYHALIRLTIVYMLAKIYQMLSKGSKCMMHRVKCHLIPSISLYQ